MRTWLTKKTKGGKTVERAAADLKHAVRRADITPDVIRLRCLGFSTSKVAKIIGTDPKLVEKIYDEHVQRYTTMRGEEAQAALCETLAKLDADEAEAGAAWERSKRDRKKIRRESTNITKVDDEGIEKVPATKTMYEREGRLPEASYLQTRNAIRDQRNKILGIYAPPKASVDEKGNTVPPVVNVTVQYVDTKDNE